MYKPKLSGAMEPNLPPENRSGVVAKLSHIVRYDELFRSKRRILEPVVKDLRSRRIFSPNTIEGDNDTDLGVQIRGLKKSLVSVDLGKSGGIYGEDEAMINLSSATGENEIAIGNDKRVTDLRKYPNSRDKSEKRSEMTSTLPISDKILTWDKLVAKSSFRRKVFKIAASHRYNRLLPFLMDMVKDDTRSFSVSPCIPETEKLGPQDKGDHSDGLKVLETEEMKNLGSELSREAQYLDELNLSKTVGETLSHEDLKGNNGLSSNGADISTAEHDVSKIDNMDLGISSNSLNSSGTIPKFSCMVNDGKGEEETKVGLKPLKNGSIKKFSTLLSCEAPDTDQLNLSGSDEGIQLDHQNQKRNENGGSSNGVDEHIQTTPPHMDIFSSPEINIVENEENPKNKIVVKNHSFACENTRKDICFKNDLTFKRKLVLNPCSRGKLYKTSGSFSYKRLLPYLMKVSNHNLSNSFDASEYPSRRTITADTEEKKTNKHLPMVGLNFQQNPTNKSEENFSSREHLGGELSLNRPTAIPISDADSSENKQTLVSAEKENELQLPLDSPNKYALPVEQITSNIINGLEHAYGGEDSEIEMTSPILSCSSGDNETLNRDDTKANSGRGTKTLDSECLDQKSSQVEESFSFDNHVNLRGILRRNPRGCRGLCNCLNCTSFRLNADRAFEFSRNQMLYVEELALDLINELSGLRNMLKESIVKSNGRFTADSDQVMEACTKALKVEEFAKCRLKEMHCDLTAHCRSKSLERPSVKFANHVDEMLIPQVDLPAADRKSKECDE